MRKDEGFTLIEMLTAVALASVLMTLGAFSLRQFWLVRSLSGATGEVVAQLRTLQQHAASESSPFIFGASFTPGSSAWSTFRYSLGNNLSDPTDDTCSLRSNLVLGTGVRVLSTTNFASASQISGGALSSGCGITTVASPCPAPFSGSCTNVVAFFPKGTATRGHVDLQQPSLGRSAAVCVSPLTARVSQRSIAESATC